MPRGIGNALAQSPGTGFLHACDVQVLTDDDLIPVDQFPAGCVGKVGPAVGDPLVDVRHHTLGFATCWRDFFLSTECELGFLQHFFVTTENQ